jgi:hypothetical protein
MNYNDSMTIIEDRNGYSIGLINDTLHNPNSVDNVVSYWNGNNIGPVYLYE